METIAVCTPSHHGAFIEEAYQSLCDQTYPHWTWYLMANYQVPEKISRDKRVKLIPYPKTTFIGQLKRKVFTLGAERHDFVVELDHDDVLDKTALEEVQRTLTQADFCYSDFTEFHRHPDGKIDYYTYPEALGWRHYPVLFCDQALFANAAFPLDSISLTYIYWAPNHIRAWRSRLYLKLSGHAYFEAGDDFNLVVRTYLATPRHQRINRCIYFYRRGQNSFPSKQDAIKYHTSATVSLHHLDVIRVTCERHQRPFIICGDQNPGAIQLPPQIGAVISTYQPAHENEITTILSDLTPHSDHETWLSLGIPVYFQDKPISEIGKILQDKIPDNWMLCYHTTLKGQPVLFFVFTDPQQHFPRLNKNHHTG